MVLCTRCLAGTTFSDDTCKKASRGLHRLQKALSSIEDAIMPISGINVDEVCLLNQYQEQLCDLKREFGDIRGNLLSVELEEGDDLYTHQVEVKKSLQLLP